MEQSDSYTDAPAKGEATANKGALRWFVGIPVVTNPLMTVDILFLAVTVWVCGTVFVAAGQFFIGDGLTHAALMASIAYAGYVSAAIIAIYLFVGLFLLANKYAALYKMDERLVYCETMRGDIKGEHAGFLRFRPFPIEPLLNPHKSGVKTLAWEHVYGALPVPAFRALVLRGKRGGTLMKVYCPDDETYNAALAAVAAHLAAKSSNKR